MKSRIMAISIAAIAAGYVCAKGEAHSETEEVLVDMPRMVIDGKEYAVIEGDLLEEPIVAADLIRRAAKARHQIDTRELKEHDSGKELIVNTDSMGIWTIWPQGERNLSYSIAKKSFESEEQYEIVRKAMEEATRSWATACITCGLNFFYMGGLLDLYPDPSRVTFIVRMKKLGSAIAIAFFPNSPSEKREMFIDPSFFKSRFAPEGILRHELGHVLGYRHEHVREGVAGCKFEKNKEWVAVTKYDPKSVMHYLCGPKEANPGTLQLSISDVDIEGHRRVYGAPR